MRKTYKSYKHSGVEWIGEIPGHWEATALKRLVAIPITDGPHETPTFIEVGVPFVSAEAVQDGTINFSACRGYISEEEDQRFSLKCKPQRGDVFLVKSGSTTGKVAYVNTDSNFNIWSPIALIRNGEMHEGRYLFYALSSNYFQTQVQLYWSFGTQPNIGMNVLENLLVIYPTKKEQQTIATYLDEKTDLIDSAIRKKEKLIELLQEERTAIINQAVTRGLDPNVKMKDSGVEWLGEIPEHWATKRLKFIADITTGNKNTEDRVVDGLYPFYVRSQTVERINSYSFEGEGILTAGDGVGVGKVFHYVNEKLDFHQRVYLLYNFKDVVGKYLFNFLRENLSKEVFRWNAKSTVDSLRLPMFQNFLVSYPPDIEEQNNIVDFINDLDDRVGKAVKRISEEVALLQEYRTALINEVVTGKRCVI